MFEKIRQALGLTKESRSWQAILSMGYRGPQWMSSNYEAFAREGYASNSTVYSCINATVRALRGVKFGAYRVSGSGLKPVPKGPLTDLIRNPNPRQSFSSIVGEWAGSMELSGNAYMEGVSIQKNADILTQPPKELYVLRPDRMFVVPGTVDIPIAGFEYRAGTTVVPYKVQLWRNPKTGGLSPRCPVMHSKYWNPLVQDGDWYGLSPIKAAARNIDSFNSAVEWNVSLTQNNARPGGIFSSDDVTLTSQQAEEYTNFIRQKFGGPGNAGRPMVLGKGFKWQQVGISPVDMDWLKGLEWNSTQICAIFGIPPEIIGDSANRTYSNFEEARKSTWMEKWLNMLDMLCDDLNSWLTPLYSQAQGDELVIGYDKDGIEAIQEDRQIKWKNAKDGQGFLTVNEQRELLGYDLLSPEIGEKILVPVGMVPLEVSAAQTEMPSLALANTQAEHQQSIAAQQSQQQQNKPKPKPGKKPTKKPAKKEEVLDVEWIDEPDHTDVLLQQIALARKSLALLEGDTKGTSCSQDPK